MSAPDATQTAEPVGRTLDRCSAVARSGARCERQAEPGTEICVFHQKARDKDARCRGRKKERGECMKCKRAAKPGHTRCELHLQALRDRHQSESGQSYYHGRAKDNARSSAQSRRRGGRYGNAAALAKRRGHDWLLDRGAYLALISEPCAYCGLPNDVRTGIGLDRLDNARGYESGNVVSCCWTCNVVRSTRFTPEEMRRVGVVIREIMLAR